MKHLLIVCVVNTLCLCAYLSPSSADEPERQDEKQTLVVAGDLYGTNHDVKAAQYAWTFFDSLVP
jgi:hypothetical protein